MTDKKVITVRPPKDSDLRERLEKFCDKIDRSLNYVAVKAIDEYLRKQKSKTA